MEVSLFATCDTASCPTTGHLHLHLLRTIPAGSCRQQKDPWPFPFCCTPMSQPFLPSPELQLGGPSGPICHPLPGPGKPQTGATAQTWSHQCQGESRNHCLGPAGCILANATQGMVDFRCYKCTLLIWGQLVATNCFHLATPALSVALGQHVPEAGPCTCPC